jgi:hypothetical protein
MGAGVREGENKGGREAGEYRKRGKKRRENEGRKGRGSEETRRTRGKA